MGRGPTKPKTKAELEMEAMSKCLKILKPLDQPARDRVIKWLVDVIEEMKNMPAEGGNTSEQPANTSTDEAFS
jgi:hypothetical protein